MDAWLLILLVLSFICGGEASLCYYGYSYYYYYYSKKYYASYYCGNGCCGYYYSRYCCSDFSGGMVAGAVVGGIVFMSVIAAIVLCLCHKQKHRGVVIAPARNQNVAIISESQTQPMSPLQPAPYPNPYYQQTYPGQATYPPQGPAVYPPPPPPAYQSDPAYPPQNIK